jgi:iron complex transport system substrate-binding protein
MNIKQKITACAAVVAVASVFSQLPLDARLLTPVEPMNTVVEAGVFPKQLRDPLGRERLLQQPPTRIASGILAADEIFAMLRIEDRVVSITDIADDPGISNVANLYPVDVVRSDADTEALLMTAPDMVVVAAYSDAATVRLLLSTGVTVLRLPQFNSFSDIESNLTTLARATDEEIRGAALLDEMRRRLDVVADAVRNQPPPRVLYYSPSGSAAGIGSLTDEMVTMAGGFNVIRETGLKGSALISQELAIALQPDVILLDIWGTTNGDPAAVNSMLHDPAWRSVPAVQNGRVYVVDAAIATTCTPFRVIGVETVARLLHPDRFPNPDRFSGRDNTAKEVQRWL